VITLEQMVRVCSKTPQERLDLFVEPLNAAMNEFAVIIPPRQAPFLAHLAHESGQFLHMREGVAGSAYDNRADLGNTEPEAIRIATSHGSSPGRWWRGNGPMQLTGYKNHKLCGEALGLDLLNHPELLEQPVDGCRSAGWFWKVGAGLNLGRRAKAYGVQEGCNLNDVADLGDFLGTCLAVNGWLNGIEDRVTLLLAWKAALA